MFEPSFYTIHLVYPPRALSRKVRRKKKEDKTLREWALKPMENLLQGVPTNWTAFCSYCAEKENAKRDESADKHEGTISFILENWPDEPTADTFIFRFNNETVEESGEVVARPPVELPILSIAMRVSNKDIINLLIQKFPEQEVLKGVLQELADDRNIRILLDCEAAAKIGPDQRAFCVISAVKNSCNNALEGALLWADEIGALEILCNNAELFSADVWHLAVFEFALQIAVGTSSVSALEILLYTLPTLPLLHSQEERLLQYIFECDNESCLNVYLHRFPERTSDVDQMQFGRQSASESLRRRCLYRLYMEPPSTVHFHAQKKQSVSTH